MTTTTLQPDRSRVVQALQRLAAADQRSHVWKKVPENLIIEACELLVTPGTTTVDVRRWLIAQQCDPGHGSLYRFAVAFRQVWLTLAEMTDLQALTYGEVATRLRIPFQAVNTLVAGGQLEKRDIAGESRIPAASLRRFLTVQSPDDDASSAVHSTDEGP